MCFAKGRSPKLSSLSPGQRRSHSGPTLQSQKALDAVAAAGDQTTQYRQVQLDLTEERTAVAAVSWLQTEKGLKPLFTEWEPLETEAETAGAKYCAAVFFHLCTAGAHERS